MKDLGACMQLTYGCMVCSLLTYYALLEPVAFVRHFLATYDDVIVDVNILLDSSFLAVSALVDPSFSCQYVTSNDRNDSSIKDQRACILNSRYQRDYLLHRQRLKPSLDTSIPVTNQRK